MECRDRDNDSIGGGGYNNINLLRNGRGKQEWNGKCQILLRNLSQCDSILNFAKINSWKFLHSFWTGFEVNAFKIAFKDNKILFQIVIWVNLTQLTLLGHFQEK